MEEIAKNQIPVIILCGGRGTRLKEKTEIIPKPLVKIGGKPILWHIMKIYQTYGFSKFLLPIGYKGEKIKKYFNNNNREDWQVEIVDTGLDTETGTRLKKMEEFINAPLFMLTYGDGVADVNLDKLLFVHRSQGKLATVTGVRPPARFGELQIEGSMVVSFQEKPQASRGYINGGFFVMKRDVFRYIPINQNVSLEGNVLPVLAQNKQLSVFCHNGYWQCMDTLRDVEFLNQEWDEGRAAWKIW